MKSDHLAPTFGFYHPDASSRDGSDRDFNSAARATISQTLATEASTNKSKNRVPQSCGGRHGLLSFLTLAALVGIVPLTAVQTNSQTVPKLIGTGAVTPAEQGWSVALSGDGSTAIAGGILDNSLVGAAWVYTRRDGIWTQQGRKLVGGGAIGKAGLGVSVALSADGNTAIVGGNHDNRTIGAAWIHTRSGGIWTEQGTKLIGTDAVGSARQGSSVALSADGNTAIVGGLGDNSSTGAIWVFTREDGAWTQQGRKLTGIDAVGGARQGAAVALAADGNTAVVGGPNDNSGIGAAWVYTRRDGIWTQQGKKLVGVGSVGESGQGISVALSVDGNTAIVGGFGDNASAGAVWVYTRRDGIWTQQGNKIVGTGAVGKATQGDAVALSADGNTAIVGGAGDNTNAGAVWVYSRKDGAWTQQGSKWVGAAAVGNAAHGHSAALSADGNTAIVGGPHDNKLIGAAWIYTRSGGIWSNRLLTQ